MCLIREWRYNDASAQAYYKGRQKRLKRWKIPEQEGIVNVLNAHK